MQESSTAPSPAFLDGFVTECQRQGMSEDETLACFHKHACVSLLARPAAREGVLAVLLDPQLPLAKSARMRCLHPDLLTLAEELRICYGDDLFSKQARQTMELPEPSWDTVDDWVKEAATELSQTMGQFDQLPLNQKILLAMMAGGAAGGMGRTLLPSAEDQQMERGMFSRFSRGALRGAGMGAGAAAGFSAGSDVAGGMNPDLRLPGMLLGGAVGGLAGHRLAGDIVN